MINACVEERRDRGSDSDEGNGVRMG